MTVPKYERTIEPDLHNNTQLYPDVVEIEGDEFSLRLVRNTNVPCQNSYEVYTGRKHIGYFILPAYSLRWYLRQDFPEKRAVHVDSFSHGQVMYYDSLYELLHPPETPDK